MAFVPQRQISYLLPADHDKDVAYAESPQLDSECEGHCWRLWEALLLQ